MQQVRQPETETRSLLKQTDDLERKLNQTVDEDVKETEATLRACLRIIRSRVDRHPYEYEREAIKWLCAAASNALAGYYKEAVEQLSEATNRLKEAQRIERGVYFGTIRPGKKGFFPEPADDCL